MIQRIDGQAVLAKLVSWPSLDEVMNAELYEQMVFVRIACYRDGYETEATLPLTNIRRTIDKGEGAFRFMGNYSNFSLVTIDGRDVIYEEVGTCLVQIDPGGQEGAVAFTLRSMVNGA